MSPQNIRKLIVLGVIILLLFGAYSLFLFGKAKLDYRNPEFKSYQARFEKCMDNDTDTPTPVADIYKAWKDHQAIDCQDD